MSSVKDFLKRKDIVITPQRYLIEALGAMAQGLFASLLIGTIIKTLGQQTGLEVLVDLGGYASAMSGPAMACAIGWALHCPPLVLFSLITVGYSANALGGAGGPLAVLIIAIVAAEMGKAVSKETKIDILVTPLVTIFVGVGLSMLIAAPIGAAASKVGTLIMWATEQAPLVMGILVSVIVGVALTLPISSAAICAALGLTGLAGGAAVAGCCAQMVGFAVMSYKENGVGGLVSQGLGTSMLQMGNIIKNPRIWIAPTLASAITGPLATCLFHFEMNGAAVSSGMGTCGLVGQIGVYTGWVNDIAAGTKAAITPMDWAAMVLICFVLPAVLSVLFCEIERKLGWIKEGDLNHDKWIGVGGKFEPFESPEDCLLREVQEETGLTLTSYRCRGVVTFLLGELTKYMFLYTADAWTGTLVKDAARNEGILEWVPKAQVEQLPIWEGDKIFFRLLKEDRPFFSLKLRYEDDTLAEAVLDGKPL